MHTGGTQRNSNSRLPKNRSIVVVKPEENGNKKDQLGILQSAQCRGVKVYGSSTKSSFEGAHKASCASSTENNHHQSFKWTLYFFQKFLYVVFFFSVDSFAYSAVHSQQQTGNIVYISLKSTTSTQSNGFSIAVFLQLLFSFWLLPLQITPKRYSPLLKWTQVHWCDVVVFALPFLWVHLCEGGQ